MQCYCNYESQLDTKIDHFKCVLSTNHLKWYWRNLHTRQADSHK